MKNILNDQPRPASCATCQYYSEDACRFLSPITLDGKAAIFPPMPADGWCGRWKNRSNAKPANSLHWTQQIAKPVGRPSRFDWDFFRGVFHTLAPTQDRAAGYNALYRLANDQVEISKSSFNLVVQKGIACGELHRIEESGHYWAELKESRAAK